MGQIRGLNAIAAYGDDPGVFSGQRFARSSNRVTVPSWTLKALETRKLIYRDCLGRWRMTQRGREVVDWLGGRGV